MSYRNHPRSKAWRAVACVILMLHVSTLELARALPGSSYEGMTIPGRPSIAVVPAPGGTFVNTYNANLLLPRTDLMIPARGLPIELKMAYSSHDNTKETPYGIGWWFNYDIRYALVPPNASGIGSRPHVVVFWGDGRTDLFKWQEADYLAVNEGVDARLERVDEDRFRVRTKHGITYDFENPVHQRVTGVADPNGNTLGFVYDGAHRLTQLTDPSGRALQLAYDMAGRLSTITDWSGRVLSYEYDAQGRQTAFTDPMGHTTSYTYDEFNSLTSITDPRGNTTSIAYTPEGQVASVATLESEHTFSFDEDALITTVSVRVDEETTAETRYVYDDNQRLVQIEDPYGYVEERSYDARGYLSAVTDANGHTTSYENDEDGNVLSVTDPLGNTTAFTYESAFDKVSSVTDPNGHTTTFAYDGNGNLVSVTDPLGNVTSHTYDAYGQRVSTTDPLGNTTQFAYTAAGDLSNVTDPMGRVTSFGYDAVGNRNRITDPAGATFTYSYDLLNRPLQEVDPLGLVSTSTYDANGNLISSVDPNGNSYVLAYDARNHLSSVTTGLPATYVYDYDGRGKLVSLMDPNGNTRRFEYDLLGRPVAEIDPLGNTRSWGYDPAGNLTSRLDADGRLTTYAYDAADRLVSVSYPDGNTINMAYDAAGNMIASSDSYAELVFVYDALDRVVSKTDVGRAKTIAYGFDAAGNRTLMTDPDGGATSYEYDASGRLTLIRNPLGQETALTRDAAGRVARQDNFNGTYTLYAYDASWRLESIRNHLSGGAVLAGFDYTYDGMANRLSVTDENGLQTAYAYDSAYRLVQVTRPDASTISYSYDPAGNRLQMNDGGEITNYTYDAADRLLAAGDVAYEWDASGNVIARTEAGETTTYADDADGRLTKIVFPDATSDLFTYDPTGQRLSPTNVSGMTTLYFHDEDDVLTEFDPGGATIARYTSSRILDEWIGMDRAGASYVYHRDALGSVRAVTDELQAEVAGYDYDPFGTLVEETGTLENPMRFTGRELIPEAGMYHYRARIHDPEAGRFTSRDPRFGELTNPAGLNGYLYVQNDPLLTTDPRGELWGWVVVAALVVVAAVAIGKKIASASRAVSRAAKAREKAIEEIAGPEKNVKIVGPAGTKEATEGLKEGLREAGEVAEEGIKLTAGGPPSLPHGKLGAVVEVIKSQAIDRLVESARPDDERREETDPPKKPMDKPGDQDGTEQGNGSNTDDGGDEGDSTYGEGGAGETSGAQEIAVLPSRFRLARPFPNPSGGQVLVRYEVPRPSPVQIQILDASGRLVRELWDGLVSAGRYTAPWDGRAAGGWRAAPGAYYLRLRAPGFAETRTLIVMN